VPGVAGELGRRDAGVGFFCYPALVARGQVKNRQARAHTAAAVARPKEAKPAAREPDITEPSKAEAVSTPTLTEVKPWMHVLVWFVGTILAALIPFAWTAASNNPSDPGPSIYTVLGAGDLYLVSIIILIAGLTEIVLLLRQIKQPLIVALLVLSAPILIVLYAAWYAGASSVAAASHAAPPHSVAYLSLTAFALAAVHSSLCVLLAAVAE
jgi:hypothetical protein